MLRIPNAFGTSATAAKLNGATGICVDDTGNLIIADKGSLRIRKIDTFGIITTLAGKGTSGFTPDGCKADTASFYYIGFIRIDKAGLIYFTDNGRIRKISASGQLLTVAGNGIPGNTGDGGPATAASIDMSAFCIDSVGNIFLADGGSDVIRKISTDGMISRYAGSSIGGYSGDGGSALAAKLRTCGGVAAALNGDVFIGDAGNNRVRMVTNHLASIVNPSEVEQNLIIKPNPSVGKIYVTLAESNVAEHDADIFTIDGRLLKHFCLKGNIPAEIMTDWPPGMYIIKISSTHEVISRTFTIF